MRRPCLSGRHRTRTCFTEPYFSLYVGRGFRASRRPLQGWAPSDRWPAGVSRETGRGAAVSWQRPVRGARLSRMRSSTRWPPRGGAPSARCPVAACSPASRPLSGWAPRNDGRRAFHVKQDAMRQFGQRSRRRARFARAHHARRPARGGGFLRTARSGTAVDRSCRKGNRRERRLGLSAAGSETLDEPLGHRHRAPRPARRRPCRLSHALSPPTRPAILDRV